MTATVSGVSMRRKLDQFQLFQLHPVAAHLRKVVMRLLDKPAFIGAAENLGPPDGHLGICLASRFCLNDLSIKTDGAAPSTGTVEANERVLLRYVRVGLDL